MLELKNDCLVFSFPEIHPNAVFSVYLHRTLRIPDDGKSYPLPPSLGHFPVKHVDDFSQRVPKKWVGRGGVMVPLYQSEALWLGFSTRYPFAVKVATGKCSAVTGKPWTKKLREKDYLVCPDQPWLDGYVVEDGTVRQFVAAPLGLGVTAEEQLTGKAEFGGLQIEVIPMAREFYDKKYPNGMPITQGSFSVGGSYGFGGIPFGHGIPGVYTSVVTNNISVQPILRAHKDTYFASQIRMKTQSLEVAPRSLFVTNSVIHSVDDMSASVNCVSSNEDMSRGVSEEVGAQLDMGLAPGGRMKQQVFEDKHGIEVWHKTEKSRCFIHMANSIGWEHVTGSKPPTVPMTASDYSRRGYPWFSYYEEKSISHGGTEKTRSLKSLAEIAKEKKLPLLPENQSTEPKHLIQVKKHPNQVRDGVWK